VVAITFTEAAAAEMATKVGRALTDVAGGVVPLGVALEALPPDEAARGARAAALVVALDHLLVATIHAFCRRLLATVPLEAGLHPGFTVDAEGLVLSEVVQETVEAAFRKVLVQEDGGDLLALAARGQGPPEIAEALATLVGKGLPPEALERDPLAPSEVAALAGRLREEARALHALLEPRLGGSTRARNAADITKGLGALARALEGKADELQALQHAVAEALRDTLVGHLAEWGNGRFNTTEERELAEVAPDVQRLAATLAPRVRQIAALDAELLDAARRALAPLLASVYTEMRARGAETFAGLLRDTRDVLVRDPAVRARRRGEITQLLVDEFQDTDRVQCEILGLLALEAPADERPGLFLIGDPKQSIYGWRNADLEAYDAFLSLVRERGGEVLGLAVNFRSLPAILDEVERAMTPVMRRQPGVQPGFEKLLPCEARLADAESSPGPRAPVEYWVSWKRSGDGTPETGNVREALELEACAVASDIRDLHDRGSVRWSEVGVLLRATSDLDAYLQALRDADVPYAVERDRSYYRRREIIEASALVRTVLDPGDHLALLTVLRSALVGVPDAALVPLWKARLPERVSELSGPSAKHLAELRGVVLDVVGELPADVPGLARVRGWEHALLAFLGALATLREDFENDDGTTFVERLRRLTLFEASEAARALGVYRVANLERFFRELGSALEEGSGDPGEVLRVLRTSVEREREQEEGRPLAAVEDAVRVMTIHKAKGLDFHHTYLVQAHHRTRTDAEAMADAEELDGRFQYVLFGAATLGWGRISDRRRQVGAAEMVRTLYVAMTRARDRLVVAGDWPSRSRPASPRSHLDLLVSRLPEGGLAGLATRLATSAMPSADSDGVRWVFPVLTPVSEEAPRRPSPGTGLPSTEEVTTQARALAGLQREAEARMGRSFSAPASEEAHRRLRELLAEEHRGDVREAPWSPAPPEASPALAAGAVVHRILEELDLGRDLVAGLARARARLPQYLGTLLEGEGARDAAARAGAILDRLVGGRTLARLEEVAPHVVARELPVLLPPVEAPEGPVGVVAGTIDLVYRDPETGALVIVDYKTDEAATDQVIAGRAAAYASQGRVYRRALREALALADDPQFELWFLQADRIVRAGR
jgi:ATP-dependent helicase/nuclease subunit A